MQTNTTITTTATAALPRLTIGEPGKNGLRPIYSVQGPFRPRLVFEATPVLAWASAAAEGSIEFLEGNLVDDLLFCVPGIGWVIAEEIPINPWSSGYRLYTGPEETVFDRWAFLEDALYADQNA